MKTKEWQKPKTCIVCGKLFIPIVSRQKIHKSGVLGVKSDCEIKRDRDYLLKHRSVKRKPKGELKECLGWRCQEKGEERGKAVMFWSKGKYNRRCKRCIDAVGNMIERSVTDRR